MTNDKSQTTTPDPDQEFIEAICDAYGKGFDQHDRNLKNPYQERSSFFTAYEYGKQVANEQN